LYNYKIFYINKQKGEILPMDVEFKALLPKKEEFIELHRTTGWNAQGLYTDNQLF
jgi:hypothetical protein